MRLKRVEDNMLACGTLLLYSYIVITEGALVSYPAKVKFGALVRWVKFRVRVGVRVRF